MKTFWSVAFLCFVAFDISANGGIEVSLDSAFQTKDYSGVIHIFETSSDESKNSLDEAALSLVGKSYYFKGNYHKAKELLKIALEIYSNKKEYYLSYATAYYISRSYKNLYFNDSTLYYSEEALKYATLSEKPKNIAAATNSLAIIYEDNSRYLDALLLYNRAIELSKDDSVFEMKMKCNMGQSYYHLGILDSALNLMNSSYRFFKTTSSDEYWRWLSTYRLANIEQSSKNQLASSYFRELLSLSTDKYDSTLALAGLSESKLLAQEEDSSLFFLKAASELANESQNLTLLRHVCFLKIRNSIDYSSNIETVPELLQEAWTYQKTDPDSISLSHIYELESKYFLKINEQEKSLDAVQKAVNTTTKHNQKTRLSKILTQKFNILNHFGHYKEALAVKEEEIKVQQELFNDRSEAVYQILRTQNEMDKQESTIANQQLEIDNNNLQITIMYISIALVISALVFIFWQYRTRSKYARKLETMFLDSRHRYMNNLLLLKNWFNEGKTDKNDELISFAQNRIDAISTVNRHLDRLSYNKDTIESKSFLEDISHNLLANREFTSEIEDVPINMSVSGPLGMITNEIITNGLKYGEEPYAIRFHKNGGGYVLEIEDHGPGIQDPEKKGTGSKVLRLLSRQLKGELIYRNKADHSPNDRGTLVSLQFKG